MKPAPSLSPWPVQVRSRSAWEKGMTDTQDSSGLGPLRAP